jgi:hypothetical protein
LEARLAAVDPQRLTATQRPAADQRTTALIHVEPGSTLNDLTVKDGVSNGPATMLDNQGEVNRALFDHNTFNSPTGRSAGDVAVKSKPELRLLMLGGNIFNPNEPKNLTALNLSVRVWNTGGETTIPEWKLVVVQRDGPVVTAQYQLMANTIVASGPNVNSVMLPSENIGETTANNPIGIKPITGTVLFSVNLAKNIVTAADTRLVLSIKDIYGTETTASQRMGDWQQN